MKTPGIQKASMHNNQQCGRMSQISKNNCQPLHDSNHSVVESDTCIHSGVAGDLSEHSNVIRKASMFDTFQGIPADQLINAQLDLSKLLFFNS